MYQRNVLVSSLKIRKSMRDFHFLFFYFPKNKQIIFQLSDAPYFVVLKQ